MARFWTSRHARWGCAGSRGGGGWCAPASQVACRRASCRLGRWPDRHPLGRARGVGAGRTNNACHARAGSVLPPFQVCGLCRWLMHARPAALRTRRLNRVSTALRACARGAGAETSYPSSENALRACARGAGRSNPDNRDASTRVRGQDGAACGTRKGQGPATRAPDSFWAVPKNPRRPAAWQLARVLGG